MRDFSISPIEMWASLWRNRSIIKAMVRRDVLGRYRGSIMGIFWSFFNPLFMLTIYTFVFSELFKSRWNTEDTSKAKFALMLFAGLLIFNLFAECINRSPSLIVSNTNYVKKVVFPLEILPWVTLGAALFHALISLLVWLASYSVFFGPPHVSALYLPIVIAPFVFFIVGISWILASLGVFLRDVSQFIGVVTTGLMFLSPIFYPATALPEDYRYLLYLNPLTTVIEQTRDALFWGKQPDFQILGIYVMVSLMIAWLGFAWFQKTRKGFADVL